MAPDTARSVVVTGGANGIGEQVCRQLLATGVRVVAVDRDAARLAALERELVELRTLCGDLTKEPVVQQARVLAETDAVLTGWVNCAGVLVPSALHEMDGELVDRILAINLRAVIACCAAAVSSFLRSGVAGSIVNLSSVHGRHPFPGHPVYAATKGGIEALTRQLCVEYGAQGIRCNAVAPGAVATDMTTGGATGDALESVLAAARALSPMDRVSTADEIASAVTFLLSDSSRSINGHVLAVDNGMSAQGRALR